MGTFCEKCPPGTKGQKEAGTSRTCTDCGIGYASSAPGSIACSKCIGNAATGIALNSTKCVGCKSGEVTDSVHAICSPCAGGAYRVGNAEAGDLPTCEECPARGTVCRNGKLTLERNAWYDFEKNAIISSETKMHTCLNDVCCLVSPAAVNAPAATTDAEMLACNVALGYFGPLCGACDRDNEQGHGFFTRSGQGCGECWLTQLTWFAVSAMALALLFVIGYFVVRHSFAASQGDYSATVQKVMISHLQMLGVLGIFKARGTEVFNDVVNRPAEIIVGSFTSMLPVKCALQSQIYGPFLLNMGMPLIMLAIAAVILIPKALGERCMRDRRKGRQAPPFKGKFNLPRRLVVLTALRDPMAAADVAEWHAPFKPSQRISGVVVFILFSFYPTLVASVASLYNCTHDIEGSAYLVVDLTVKCYEGTHLLFMAFAFIGAIVCVPRVFSPTPPFLALE